MKRPLSLIEVVIGLGLTAILLTSLFSCYRHLVMSKIQVEAARAQLFPHLLLQARLTQIFDNVPEGHSLYTDQGKLHLTFDNGVDREPTYCGLQTAAFSLEGKNLTLSYSGKQRKEVIQTDIKELIFSFYDAKQKTWVDTWQGSSYPTQVALHLDKETYTFSLPSADHRASYP